MTLKGPIPRRVRAGKGGTIRRITERTSPRVFKHIALPAPSGIALLGAGLLLGIAISKNIRSPTFGWEWWTRIASLGLGLLT